jgi:tetratricopeptide (TPR) repeat protein
LNRQAESEMRANRFESAAALATRSVALAEQAGLTKGMPYLEVLNTRANAIENIGKGRDALAIYRRIDRLLEESGRGKTMFRTVIHNNIGTALSNLGEMTAAAPMLRRAMDEFRQSDPGDNVHPAILINYCRTMMFLRRLDEAALWYERLYRQSAAQNDPNMQDDGAYGMAEVEILRGRLDEAETWIAEEGRVQKRLAEPRVANAPYLEGTLAKARGDLGRARSALRRALTAQGYDRGERTYQMQAALIHAAEAALEAHAAQEALEYARAAHGIAAADPLTETRSAYVGEADLLEGRALLASGDTAGARTALARARAALIAGAGEDHPRAREADALLARLPS